MDLTLGSFAQPHETNSGVPATHSLLVPSKQALRRPSLSTQASVCSLGREESHESMSNLPSKNCQDTDDSSYSGSPRDNENTNNTNSNSNSNSSNSHQAEHMPAWGRGHVSMPMPPPGLSMPKGADNKKHSFESCSAARRATPQTSVSGLRDKLRQKGDNVMASLGTQEARELPAWLMPAKPKDTAAPTEFQRIGHPTNDCATRASVTPAGSRRKGGKVNGSAVSHYMAGPHGAPRGEEPSFVNACAARVPDQSWRMAARQPGEAASFMAQHESPAYASEVSPYNRSSGYHPLPQSVNPREVSVPVVFHF